MALPAEARNITLDDKYTLEEGRVYATGIQALVRLPMMMRQRDLARGLNTGGFISGYRGSPLGGLDQNLWRARKFLEENHIKFQPGLNEDLALTAIWGSQQLNMFEGAKYDGVFAMWYGKGPGVDRCGDVMKHGNAAGTSPHGGVLMLAGDDHDASSSTLPHQTDHNFMGAMMPLLYPANVQEILDFGILGWEMSRYSGCWIGFKCVAENVESSASVYVDPGRLQFQVPNNFDMPEGGLNIRWPDGIHEQEDRLQRYKVYAALAYARTNRVDRIALDSPKPRLGIITSGKSYLDVRQALQDLGIDEKAAKKIGLRLYKVGMVWPLEKDGAREFAHGLEEVVVIEEKRALVENQLKEQLYNWDEKARPRVVGKFDENGKWLLPASGDLTPGLIARVLAERIGKFYNSDEITDRVKFLERKERALKEGKAAPIERVPYFCSGCPHNTSTRVPEGSRATAGIGCHFMAVWMPRSTSTFTHMGGEGAPWIGQAPFTETKHIFANLGDGTYYHSGILAIRFAVAAGANMTYKILYNDAVAMTGGQPVEGQPTVADIANQVAAEGVKRVVVVSDEPDKYPVGIKWPEGTTFRHRDDLDEVQRQLREEPGVTVLLYDQTCAAEKRRRRKRGEFYDPPRRVFINEDVCEGCGDCSYQSNCMSVVPNETEFGRKRMIDQSTCNKDYSCVKGFCPSFVSVYGGTPRKAERKGPQSLLDIKLPEPELPDLKDPYGILVTGIGGTGVITIGALLGMAAHIEGKGVSVLDQTGLAQKNGAVMSHIRFGKTPEDLQAVRIAAGEADAVIGCDIVVATGAEALAKMRNGVTRAVVNSHEQMTAGFIHNRDMGFPEQEMEEIVRKELGKDAVDIVEATELATRLMGDSIATNMMMLGYAYQKGMVPVSAEAIEKAIELNGIAIESNKHAFTWGRQAAVDLEAVRKIAFPAEPISLEAKRPKTLDELVERRVEELTRYQNARYARRYEAFVRQAEAAERNKAKGESGLAEAVAHNLFKLMAYKDEYEVARLFTDGKFERQLRETFDGDFKLKFHLAPPLFAKRDPRTGHLQKEEFGPWVFKMFKLMAKLRFLRGTVFDIFGKTEERRMERRLIEEYRETLETVMDKLSPSNHDLAVEIASIPSEMRGFGHIKEHAVAAAKKHEARLMELFLNPKKRAAAKRQAQKEKAAAE